MSVRVLYMYILFAACVILHRLLNSSGFTAGHAERFMLIFLVIKIFETVSAFVLFIRGLACLRGRDAQWFNGSKYILSGVQSGGRVDDIVYELLLLIIIFCYYFHTAHIATDGKIKTLKKAKEIEHGQFDHFWRHLKKIEIEYTPQQLFEYIFLLQII